MTQEENVRQRKQKKARFVAVDLIVVWFIE
jgi:hypothetical protein